MFTRRNFSSGAIAACAISRLLSTSSLSASNASVTNLRHTGATQLKADRALRSPSLKSSDAAGMWVDHWLAPDQHFAWPVRSDVQRKYYATLLVAATGGSRIVIETDLGSVEAHVPRSADYWGTNWQRVEVAAPLAIGGGVSHVRVHAPRITGMYNQKFSVGGALLGLELVPAAELEAHRRVIRERSADATWLGKAAYGLMVQWGEWSYPQSGPKALWPKQIEAFDVERFADLVARSGAGYLIWSATWRTYYFPAPIAAIDRVIKGRTCERDLIAELAVALLKRGIKLILYYNGITNDEEWHRCSGYPGTDASTANDRFDTLWRTIVEEIGVRYGDRLAGWLIDEGSYPRNFNALSKALKAGFAQRVVAINPWIRCRLTDFQDYWVGEGANLLLPPERCEEFLSTLDPHTGRFTRGPQTGLQSHGCFLLDTQSTLTDWAIWQPDAKITDPLISEHEIRQMARLAVRNKFALSFNIMMYEDGTVSDRSVSRLELMKQCVAAERFAISS